MLASRVTFIQQLNRFPIKIYNTIGRRHFTRHGQHLTMRGKRLLARLVVASLRRASLVSVSPSQPPPPLPLPSPAVPAESPSIAAAEPHPLCATRSDYTLDTTPRQLRGDSEIFTSQ
ncbi:hypothetical protein J6590_090225 [Homalodisca vitripennis]|nr:hypothetical protein J6590_090225 [Homalodisca vitripennis]